MASLLGKKVFEINGQGPPPTKDFFQLTVTKTEVIWRSWKISLRIEFKGAAPGENRMTHDDYLHNARMQRKVGVVFGQQILQYTQALCQGNFDYLERLPNDLLLQILAFLELKDLCNSPEFWEQTVRGRCDELTPEMEALANAMGWRKIFFAFFNTKEHQQYVQGEYQTSPNFDKFLQWKEYEKQKITDKYFHEFRTLGKGGFGEVKNSGQMYACKKLCKKRLKQKNGEGMALLEKQILEKVNSLFLVNLSYAYDTKTHLCLVMTLMNGGDLRYHIYNIGEKGLEIDRINYYIAQVTTGILHLHAMDIAYRDMKPENVLLDSFGQCRLSDLGLAVELPSEKTINQKAGTSGYMAPEILKKEPYRMSVDWWALGCSIYEMVAARLPFKDYKEKVQKEEVARRTLEDECKNEDPRKHEWFKGINFPRLEAGLIDPPWVPKPNVVYAKDTGDIKDFSEIKGIVFDDKDDKFFKEFNTGAVPIAWQQEMIDSGLFDELNDPNRKESAAGLDDEEKKSKSCTLL
ncbi:unnamed protein product [Coregonus sp. 'balchen']|nr:unnamed protein product [Coregonus sp. 'balchen']